MPQGQFRHRADGSALEKLSAGLGFLVTAAMVGFLAWKALVVASDDPPEVTVRADKIVASGNGYVVEIVARNDSPTTAADLQVEGVLKDGQSVLERSQASLDYVPGDSKQRGGLIFAHDPSKYVLEIRPTGYQLP